MNVAKQCSDNRDNANVHVVELHVVNGDNELLYTEAAIHTSH